MIEEYKPEHKLLGNRLIVEITSRQFDRNGVVLGTSIVSAFDTMKVVKVGDMVKNIKVGDEVILDYVVFHRVQPFTLDSKEGFDLTLAMKAAQESNDVSRVSPENYKYRLIQYHDIVTHKPN